MSADEDDGRDDRPTAFAVTQTVVAGRQRSKPLFGYGTFRRASWRNAILGFEYPAQPATLRGWRRVAAAARRGYLSLSMRETLVDLELVHGMLIELDYIGWVIADAWEEVPTYRLVTVEVNTMAGAVDALMYVYAYEREVVPVEGDPLALIADAEVEHAIEAFQPTMRRIRSRHRW